MDNLPMGSMPLEDVTVSATNATQPPDIRRGRSMNRLALTRSWAGNWSWSVGLLAILLTVIGGLALVSDAFAQAPQPPARPTGLVIDSLTDSAVTISWDDPADPSITGYEILRRHFGVDDYGVFHSIQDDTGTNAVSYTDTTVEAGESYVYRVKAINAAGRSQRSSYARADLPEAPDDDTLTFVDDGNTLTLIDKGDNSDTRRQDAATTLVATLTGSHGTNLPLDSTTPLRALLFTTGDNASGYDLSSVGVAFGEKTDNSGSDAANLTITAKLYKDPVTTGSSLSLGDEVEGCTLSVPASITENASVLVNVTTSFAAPDSCPALKSATVYAVALERDSSSNQDIAIQRQNVAVADDNPAPGWTASLGYLFGTSSSLNKSLFGNLRFEIKGTVVATNNAATGAPTISGDAELGSVLTAAPGDIADPDGLDNVSYSYQWLRSGAVIAGATAQRYYPSDADVGSTIEVEVSFEDDKNNPEELTSGSTSAVPASATVTVPWSATMEVGRREVLGDSQHGYDDVTLGSLRAIGALSPASFTIGDDEHTVHLLFHQPFTPNIQFSVDSLISVPFRLVHGQSGSLSSLDHAGQGRLRTYTNYAWALATSPWAESDKVAVALVVPKNFAPTGLPTISGTAQVGETLTAGITNIADQNGLPDTDTFTYQWLRVDSTDPDNVSLIAGARSSTYEPTADDVGHMLRVAVGFRDLNGYEEAVESDPTAIVTATVTVAGEVQTLVKNTGQTGTGNSSISVNFEVTATGFTTGDNTLGYTLSSFALRTTSAGTTADLTVTLHTSTTDSSNKTVPDTAASGLVCTLTNPAMTAANALTSFAAPDGCGTLTATTTYFAVVTLTTTDNSRSMGYGTVGSGEDAGAASGWSISNGEVWKGAENADWSFNASTPAIEVKGTIVGTAVTNNAATGTPSISGTVALGEALTADTSGISDDDGKPSTAQGFEYQWYRGSTAITGATAPNYYPSDADVGQTLKVEVSFEDNGGTDEGPLASSATIAVPASTTVKVPWSATVTAGEETGGSWEGFLGSALNFLATPFGSLSDSAIVIGTDSHSVAGVSYNPSGSGTLTLYVDTAFTGTVSLAYGADATLATTAATAGTDGAFAKYDWSPHDDPGWSAGDKVAVAIRLDQSAATGKPAVTGTAQVGETLTAGTDAIMDANGLPSSFSYQWQSSNDGGTTWEDITGATSSTYDPVAADVGKTLRVVVSFVDLASFDETVDSEPTLAVAAAAATACTGALVCNLVETVSGDTGAIRSTRPAVAQAFTTGSNPGGYSLASVDVNVNAVPSDTSGISVAIYTQSGSDPGSAVHTLQKPASFGAGVMTLNAPAGATLDADTTYFVYISNTRSDAGFALNKTSSNDQTGETGWSIADEGRDLGLSWGNLAGNDSLLIAVKGAAVTVTNTAATGAPTITGTTTVGQTLTAAKGTIADANGLSDPLDNLEYQWIRVDGATETVIFGATSRTYVLRAADQGKRIKVRLTFDDRAGFSESRTSDATATIQASTAVRQVTSVSVPSPRSTSAVAYVNVSVGGAATVHARWRLVGVVTWRTASQTVDASFDGAVEFSLAGLDPSSNYEIQASMNSGFTVVKTATFRTVESIEVCSRSMPVLISILRALDWSTWCGDITPEQLASITQLDLSHWYNGIDALRQGDFAGLTGLWGLYLNNNDIASLPSGIFQDLSSLEQLHLGENNITTLNSGVFTGLSNLKRLWFGSYQTTSTRIHTIATDVFNPLTELVCISFGYDPGLTLGHFTNNTKLLHVYTRGVNRDLDNEYQDPDGICRN